MNAFTNDLVVVSYLLQKAAEKGEGFTSLQLNKLLYIAHGWVLGVFDRPLFDNSNKQIQAWKYGPVIENVYDTLKDFGRDTVTFDAFCDHLFNSNNINVKIDYKSFFSQALSQLEKDYPKVCQILDWVYRMYGDFSAGQLVDITHRHGTPWKDVYGLSGLSWETRGSE